ncbi:MAG TPA: RsmE family RNA methyltransferase [Lachnospiraceae bacterium]|nr:RsmE family RNA methyltransferase [Lachnospiraceae bacterium]
MQHFFVEPSQISGHEIRIVGVDVNHIKNVLRMHTGEVISVSSNGEDNNEYRCIIQKILEDEIVCKLMFVKEDGVELPARITLFQGLPKADKMELIIQKAVELGVYEIVPVATRRCVVKLDEKKAASKITRWQAISESAAKQSKRAIIPKISNIRTMKEAIEKAKLFHAKAIPYEMAEGMQDTRQFIDAVKQLVHNQRSQPITVGIFIGSEGGFDENEIAAAKTAGITPISLGKRILRTETAGMTVLSILMYQLECEDI